MITGECPYEDCEDWHMIECADECPAFSKEVCDTCGRTYWLKHSRMFPEAFTEEDFNEKYDVNEQDKSITEK